MLGSFDHLEGRPMTGMYFSEVISVDGHSLQHKDSRYSLQYVVHMPQEGKEGCVELQVKYEGVTEMCHFFYKEDLNYMENLVITLTQALWNTEYSYDSIRKFNQDIVRNMEIGGAYQSTTNTSCDRSYLYYIFIDEEGEKYLQMLLSEYPKGGKITWSICVEFDEHTSKNTSFFLRMLEDLRTVTRTSTRGMYRVVFTTTEEADKASKQKSFVAWRQENIVTSIVLYVPIAAVQAETKTGRLNVVGDPTIKKLCDLRGFRDQEDKHEFV
ncbi:hypothetical protein [Bacillus phage SDFMU_Pbc]|uniref:Uncharacterized protein n=1 Tax=Bacillus phage SDFMU_Pbc TaxID=3076135 RepID=A0AA96KRC5_9CAUD|nr:hypothetical protein [Bacillus phage SDFMU_Pbc]